MSALLCFFHSYNSVILVILDSKPSTTQLCKYSTNLYFGLWRFKSFLDTVYGHVSNHLILPTVVKLQDENFLYDSQSFRIFAHYACNNI